MRGFLTIGAGGGRARRCVPFELELPDPGPELTLEQIQAHLDRIYGEEPETAPDGGPGATRTGDRPGA